MINNSDNIFDSKRLSHAYIVTSNALADKIAMAAVCSARDRERPCMSCSDCSKASRHTHPDIMKVDKLDGKHIISVDQIRELKQDVYVVPNDSMQKAYVVENADIMNSNAQNAFLRILEEPPAHAVFILCTETPTLLLPTVRSRCVELKSHPTDTFDDALPDDTNEHMELVDQFVEALAGDNIKLMECMFRIDKLDRLALADFLNMAHRHVVSSLRDTAQSPRQGDGSSVLRQVINESASLLQHKTDEPSPCLARKLAHAESILIKANDMLDLNVSAGHISGFICANVLEV